jgi:hypothetical protein
VKHFLVAIAALLGACAAPATLSGAAGCRIDAGDMAWLKAAPTAWVRVETGALKQPPMSAPPAYVFYDSVCAYRSEDGRSWTGSPHRGEVKLPDGQGLPPQVASFAAAGDDGRPFMVMGLPTVWRSDGVSSEMGLEYLMFAVFTHEMAHLLQFETYNTRIDVAARAMGMGDDLTDDIVQDRFGDDPVFAASIVQETQLLFGALEGDRTQGLAKAREAVDLMAARRKKFFSGDREQLGTLEDIFLTMEGLGQFAGYSWLIDRRGGGLSPAMALPGTRRGGRHWSQDEGLAVFLVIDRFIPDWQARAFGVAPETALQMLASL